MRTGRPAQADRPQGPRSPGVSQRRAGCACAEAQARGRYLDENGLTYTMAKTGYVGQRPEVSIRTKAWERVRREGSELGIAAASRSRLDEPKPPSDEFDPTREILKITAPTWKA